MNIIKKAIAFAIMLLIIIALVSLHNYIEAEDNKTIENNNAEKEKPGFEGVFAIAGFLAITYLVLRQRE